MRQYIYPNGYVADVEEKCANHLLVEIALLDSTLTITNAPIDVEFDGKVYLASGHLLDDAELSASVDEPIDDIDLPLSAVDLVMLAAIADKHHNAPVTIHRAWLALNYQVAAVDVSVWAGIVNNYTDNETDTSHELTLNLTNELATFEAAHGLQLTQEAHQRLHPDDTGMRHALVVDRPEGEWGHEDRRQDGGMFGQDIYTPGPSVDLNLDTTAKRAPLVFGRALVEPITVMRQICGQDARYLATVDVLAAGRTKGIVRRLIDGVNLNSPEGIDYFGIGQTGNGKPYIVATEERLGQPESTAYEWLVNYPAGVFHPGDASKNQWPDFLATDRFAGLTTALTVHRNHKDSPFGGPTARRYVLDGALVWDPRDPAQNAKDDTTWQWSSNPALCTLHFMRLPKKLGGMGLPDDKLILGDFITEANWIDATEVMSSDGQPRSVMSCNLLLDTSKPVMENLRAIHATCRGRLRRAGGRFGLAIDRARASVMSLDENDFTELDIAAPDVDDRYNQVTVEFTDASLDFITNTATWPATDSAEHKAYLEADRYIENSHKINVKGIDNHDEAIQLAEVTCRRSRSAAEGSLPGVAPRCARLEVGDVIGLSDADRGWSNRLFEITKHSVNGSGEELEVDLDVVVYDPNEFVWSDKPAQPLPPSYGTKPIAVVPIVKGIAYVGPTTQQPQGRLTWVHEWDWTDHYDVAISKNGTQVASGPSSDGDYLIPALDAGDYLVTVIRVSNLGKSSEPVTLDFTLALPAVPSLPSGAVQAGNTYVLLQPALAGLAYRTEFEFAFRGLDATAPRVIRARGRAYQLEGLAPATQYHFSIRAVNPLGVSAWVDVTATTTRDNTALNELLDVPPGTSVGDTLAQFDRDLGVTSMEGLKNAIEGFNTTQESAEQGQTQAILLKGQQLQAAEQKTLAATIEALQAKTAEAGALIAEVKRAISYDRYALAEQSASLTAEIGDARAEAQELARTAVGYWEDGNGVIQSETDPEYDAPEGWVWRERPLAEVIRKLKIQTANGYASYQQLGQAFETVDGQPRARGGWLIDENGQQTGVVGHAGRLDLLAALLRMGVMVDGQYKSLFELDANTNTLRIVASLVLGDGHTVASLADIRAQDGDDGDTIVQEFQYSSTGSSWHYPAVTGDRYQRQRTVTNGVASAWSAAAEWRGADGEPGQNGSPGAGTHELTLRAGVWPGTEVATDDFEDHVGRLPVKDDVLIYWSADKTVFCRYRWSGTAWVKTTAFVHGDMVVTDTFEASRIKAGTELIAAKIKGAEYIDNDGVTLEVRNPTPFGPDNLVYWSGRSSGNVDGNGDPIYANLTKAAAASAKGEWRAANGDRFFGGSISGAILHTDVANPTKVVYTAGTIACHLGPFSTNGHAKTISFGLRYNASSTGGSGGTASYSMTLRLQRRISGGNWSTLTTKTISWQKTSHWEGETNSYDNLEMVNSTLTYTDNNTSTGDHEYRLEVTAHDRYHATSHVHDQEVTLVSHEEP